ncbi:DUF4046 domain-containing protein [Bacillus thuringiensis]|uniref:DUF4046 domain-containing protein n=1 Tax=Bacillus thuringiensis TaxID=1428 RepID=UPI001C0B6183|nr:DUF4046 domain-containing protein [Bacillus thuringiensis]MDR5024114.1 DUF4046 domain-containing protein [Bacillus thuringiensis]MEC3298071.1 DUF4046 domain-containing protein [Bacillus thuringiensis]MEC3400169.1 DUF4046 domain-containing protein [Bacillus thuringiensis]QWS48355.1 DUF4046 domain-containing protein [Bacillus thuringiensis]
MKKVRGIKIEEIFQEILDGKRFRFPPNTWKGDNSIELARRVTKYLIEEKLKWDEQDIKQNWSTPLIVKSRLRGLVKQVYQNSPFKMLDDAYPNHFKEWELNMTPLNFWTKEKALEVLQYVIEEKENLSRYELLDVYGQKWLSQQKLGSPLRVLWEGSPYAMINDLYPGVFKEWQFQMVPNKFWTKEKAREALRWTIEEKEKISQKKLIKIYDLNWLKNHGLGGACTLIWNGDTYAMINDLYPNCFKEWEFKVAPNDFWTKEKAREALRWIIEEKEMLTEEQLLRVYTSRWVKKRKLGTPLVRYWQGSPYAMINDLYPQRYTKAMFKSYRYK